MPSTEVPTAVAAAAVVAPVLSTVVMAATVMPANVMATAMATVTMPLFESHTRQRQCTDQGRRIYECSKHVFSLWLSVFLSHLAANVLAAIRVTCPMRRSSGGNRQG